MPFNITFDYRFDTAGFFSNPSTRMLVEEAANAWEKHILDEFDDIPSGVTMSVRNPETQNFEDIVLENSIDDVLIFLGSDDLPDNTAGVGGPTFGLSFEDVNYNRVTLTDFEPWAGSISVDPSYQMSDNNFRKVMIHEIGHVLGIGSTEVFRKLVSGDQFLGFNSMELNNGNPIPLSADRSHIEEGFSNDESVMDVAGYGITTEVSNFDKALLADIGYEVDGFVKQGNQIPPNLSLNGDASNNVLDGGEGDDQISGEQGNDLLFANVGNDTLWGGDGDDSLYGDQGNDFLNGQQGNDILWGGDGDDALYGDQGNDFLNGQQGNDILWGGSGQDTGVYSGNQNSYSLTLSHSSMTIADRRGDGNGTDTLVDIESLDFDTDLLGSPFDLTNFGGTSALSASDFESFIELYIAYFNRSPDAIGLNFWGTAFANGTSLEQMATLFVDQDETRATYPDGTSSTDFVTAVYNNVLGRIPDQAGFNFWIDMLNRSAETGVTRDQFILDVLRGVQAGSSDREFLDNKVDIGAYFAVHRGMSDVGNASAAMALFDGSQASINQAVAAIDGFYQDALDPNNGEFLLQVVGVLDPPVFG